MRTRYSVPPPPQGDIASSVPATPSSPISSSSTPLDLSCDYHTVILRPTRPPSILSLSLSLSLCLVLGTSLCGLSAIPAVFGSCDRVTAIKPRPGTSDTALRHGFLYVSRTCSDSWLDRAFGSVARPRYPSAISIDPTSARPNLNLGS